MTGLDIRFSVPDLLVSRAGRDEESRERAFLDAVARECDAVELFVTTPREPGGPFGFLNVAYQLRGPVERLQEYGLDVASVHGTPMYDLCANGGWERCLSAVKDAQSSLTEDGDREPYADPSVLTAHPPRFPTYEEPDLDSLRAMLAANLAETAVRIEDTGWLSTSVAVENVCPRGRFEYLLTTPADARRLREAHQLVELAPDATPESVPDSMQFTCDLGHAREPLRMLEAMAPLASVHVHGAVPDDERRLAAVREEYGLGDEEQVGSPEPGGEYQHLPPQAGELPIGRVFDRLDDRDYHGPMVVELAPPYRTPAVVGETIDYVRDRH